MIGGKRLSAVEQLVLYGRQYIRPPITFMTVQSRPRYPGNPATAHGFGANAGRTNGMPWDGTSPVSATTVIDAPKTGPQTPKERARIIRTNPSE